MTNVWFTSDTHFEHANIIIYCNRPWPDKDEMCEGLVENWNSTIAPDDTVFHGGDFSMNPRAMEKWAPKLNGKKFITPGNHDSCHPMHKHNDREKARFEAVGLTVLRTEHVFKPFELSPRQTMALLFSHMPYEGDNSPEERYPQWRPKDQGMFLLHGHLHSPPEKRLGKRRLDVGVDGHGWRPWHIDEILEEIKGAK